MAILNDVFAENKFFSNFKKLPNIIFYRFNQYYGSFRGNRYDKKEISSKLKEIYFYPSSSQNNNIEIDY